MSLRIAVTEVNPHVVGGKLDVLDHEAFSWSTQKLPKIIYSSEIYLPFCARMFRFSFR